MKVRLAVVTVIIFLMGTLALAQSRGRTEHYNDSFTWNGFPVGSCGSFDILADFTAVVHGVVVFDKEGLPVRELSLLKVTKGQSVYYNSTDPNKFVLGGPGELEVDYYLYEDGSLVSDTWIGVPFKVVLPGYGAIFMETGRAIWDFTTSQLLFNSGQNQYVDGDLAALCNALQ